MNGVNRTADPGGCEEARRPCGIEAQAVLLVFPAVIGVRRYSVDWVGVCYFLFISFGNFSVYKYKRTK